MIIDELMCQFSSGTYDERLMDIYVDDNKLNYQKELQHRFLGILIG